MSVVPVLPAAGRPPSSRAFVAVPSLIGDSSRLVTPRATSAFMTCLHATGLSLICLPFARVIDSIGLGGQYLPSAARVAKELASWSGEVESEPRTMLAME